MANPGDVPSFQNSSAQRSFAAEPYDSVAAVLASKQITSELEGERIFTKDGYCFEVVASGGNETTAGGAKLRYVADQTAGFGLLVNARYVERTPGAGDPNIITSFGGRLYGCFDNKLYHKTSASSPWVETCSLPNTELVRHLVPMADGQVVLVTGTKIYKSGGWGTGSVTWSLKVTNSGGSAVFLGFSTAGSEGQSKMIVGEYAGGSAVSGWENSKYAWATKDSGATWSIVYDAEARYPDDWSETHIHSACYDPWSDLFFVVEGHTDNRGIYYSADPFANPNSWARIAAGSQGGGLEDGQPTDIVPTDKGIVLSSDGPTQGFWVIGRGSSPADMTVQPVWEWPAGGGGVLGFGRCHFRDPKTGVVYFGYQHNYVPNAINPLAVFACDGSQGGMVWRGGLADIPPVGTVNVLDGVVVTPWGELIGRTAANSDVGTMEIKGEVTRGAGYNTLLDPGRVLGGIFEPAVKSSRGAAIGSGSYAGANSALAVGPAASVTGSNSTAIGVSSHHGGTNGVTLGSFNYSEDAQVHLVGYNIRAGANSVVTGSLRNLQAYQNLVSIGAIQTLSGDSIVAIGHNVTVGSGIGGVAVGGTLSQVMATQGTVWGHNSKVLAGHVGSTVIGYTLESTAAHQVQLGSKHIELKTATAVPTNGAADTARLFTRKNAGDKQELCVIFPTGSIIVLGTEA